MGEILIDRVLPSPEAAEALHEALKQKLGGKVAGISKVKTQIKVILTDKATTEDDNEARQLVLAHDFNLRTPEQTKRVRAKQDFADMVGDKATESIADIETDLAAIAAADNAALKQILSRTLRRQRAIIKAFARFVDFAT